MEEPEGSVLDFIKLNAVMFLYFSWIKYTYIIFM